MSHPFRTLPVRLLPKTAFFPLVFLFCSGLGGAANLTTALAGHYFFQGATWWVPWVCLLAFNFCLMGYLKPAFHLAACPDTGEVPPAPLVRKAVHRFRHLPWFAVVLSTGLLFAGDALAGLFTPLKILVNLASGFFVGVLVHFFLENALFEVKRLIVARAPDLALPYHSLYFKFFLVLSATTIYLVVQTLSTLPTFLMVERPAEVHALLIAPLDGHAGAWTWMKKNGDVLFNPAQYGAKDVLEVFGFQMVVALFFILMMVRQIKLMIQQPLNTINGRLRDLNRGRPEDLCTITVVQNDEFSQVFTEINRLIDTQKSALSASQERLSHVVTRAADPIVVFDSAGTIRTFNPAAEEFFGYTEAEARAGSFAQMIVLPEEVACACETTALPLITYLLEEKSTIARHEGLHKDGRRRPFESNISTAQTPEGPLFTAVLRDISGQLAIEENLTKAKVAAENANRMKSEFLANMSHELRTPLNAVLGFTQLLDNDKNLTDGQREKIRTISRSGEHLLDLINDILDISKIEAGKIEMHTTVFDLHDFVTDLRDMFALRAKKKGLNLDVEILDGLPQYVEGDLGKLRQVVINLLGNAVKFTSEGGIALVVGPDGDKIRFSVNDSGRGIPEDELEAVLQPFVQSSITDHEGGTGLGLTISSRFIEMMGGRLEVQSVVDQGSTFSFDVALAVTDRRPEAPDTEIKAAAVKAGTEALALVVDDKVTNRLVLKEMLEGAGFTVMEAENGQEALSRAAEYGPQIIFMDIKMPVLDGYDAVVRLKADPATRAIPVFALTASAFKHDEQRIADSGFNGFLAKPFKQSALFRLIRDNTDVELEYETAAPTEAPGPTAPIDYGAVLTRLGPEGLAALDEAALINDFGALKRLADGWSSDLPDFAAALKALASSFDEAGLQRELQTLNARQEGRP